MNSSEDESDMYYTLTSRFETLALSSFDTSVCDNVDVSKFIESVNYIAKELSDKAAQIHLDTMNDIRSADNQINTSKCIGCGKWHLL
jgi:hypothetical protein